MSNRTHLLRSHTHFLAHPKFTTSEKTEQRKVKCIIHHPGQLKWLDLQKSARMIFRFMANDTSSFVQLRSPLFFISLECCNNDSCTSHFLSRCWRNIFDYLLSQVTQYQFLILSKTFCTSCPNQRRTKANRTRVAEIPFSTGYTILREKHKKEHKKEVLTSCYGQLPASELHIWACNFSWLDPVMCMPR